MKEAGLPTNDRPASKGESAGVASASIPHLHPLEEIGG